MRPVLRAALAATALTAALATPAASAQAATGPVYVALGDSFAAAPLVPVMTSLACHRSSQDYPAVLAGLVHASSFTDVSCDSAKTGDMTNPQSTHTLGVDTGSVPPQFDALSADTTLVTLTIGGGDTGLVGVAENCVNYLPPVLGGKSCVPTYSTSVPQRIAAFGPSLAAVLDGIHARAPQARVIVTGYGTYIKSGGCWPAQPYYAADADFLQGAVDQLNGVISTEAAAHNATYVDLRTPGIGHDSCAAESTRWLEGIVPGSIAAPLHPNKLGSANFATLIATTLNG